MSQVQLLVTIDAADDVDPAAVARLVRDRILLEGVAAVAPYVTVQERRAALEALSWAVDLWPTSQGEWCVQLMPRGAVGEDATLRGRSYRAATLEVALAAAVAGGPPVPVYSPRPPVVLAEQMWVEKRGQHWGIRCADGWVTSGYQLKRDAVAGVETWAARMARDAQAWDETVGPLVEGRTEGVDYRWKPV